MKKRNKVNVNRQGRISAIIMTQAPKAHLFPAGPNSGPNFPVRELRRNRQGIEVPLLEGAGASGKSSAVIKGTDYQHEWTGYSRKWQPAGPGLISNMIVNALVSHMITFKYHSVVPLILPIP